MKCLHQNSQRLGRFGSVTLYECQGCKLIFTDIYNDKKFDPKKIYSDFYTKEIPGRFNFGIEFIVKLFRLYRAFKIFTIYPKAKSILDIGSGRGFTLYFLRKIFKYDNVVGTQIAAAALKFSREKLGLNIYSEDLLNINLEEEQFDLVTIWHVLEHVKDPEAYIEKIYRLLKGHGRVVIEVPNFSSWTRKFTGKNWLGLDFKHHLWFFAFPALSKLLEKHAFKIKLVRTFSSEYSVFMSTQSIVSKLTGSDQLIFNWLQGVIKFKPILIIHIVLFILLAPACFIINLLLFFTRQGEVLLIVAEKGKK